MKRRIIGTLTMLLLVLALLPVMTTDVSAKMAAKPILVVSSKTSGDKAVKLSWIKVSGADKYVVYGARCGKTAVKIKTVKGDTSYTVKKISGKKLAAHKNYKFYVVAYKGNKKIITSDTIHLITGNTSGKYANISSISVKNTSIKLNVGKSKTITPIKKIAKGKKHIPEKSHGKETRFYSSDTHIATVSSTGKVTAISAGKVTIYVQDNSGKYCKVKVTVKGSATPTPTGEPDM